MAPLVVSTVYVTEACVKASLACLAATRGGRLLYHFKDEDVVEQAHAQVEEELAEMIDHFKASHRCLVPAYAPPGEEEDTNSATPPVSSADSSSAASDDGEVQLAVRPGNLVARGLAARRGSTNI